MTLRTGSLCTGYGGLDYAVQEVFETDLLWIADNAESAKKLLEYRYSEVPNLGDLRNVNWADVPRIDILTAGFPCQPVSSAGKKLGIADERWLWPEVENAIRNLRPRIVFLENVSAILVRGLGAVLAGLASCGYVGSYRCIRASDIGAPHKRERWFAVAHPYGERLEGSQLQRQQTDERPYAGNQDGVASWGKYAKAISRWERTLGRPAPFPVLPGRIGSLNPMFVEWAMGLPQGWVTDVPGLSHQEQLHLLGNGVVPQQAEYAFRSLICEVT